MCPKAPRLGLRGSMAFLKIDVIIPLYPYTRDSSYLFLHWNLLVVKTEATPFDVALRLVPPPTAKGAFAYIFFGLFCVGEVVDMERRDFFRSERLCSGGAHLGGFVSVPLPFHPSYCQSRVRALVVTLQTMKRLLALPKCILPPGWSSPPHPVSAPPFSVSFRLWFRDSTNCLFVRSFFSRLSPPGSGCWPMLQIRLPHPATNLSTASKILF